MPDLKPTLTDEEGVLDRLALHFDALADPKINRGLPGGTRDDRCRRAGMIEAFTIAAQRTRSAIASPGPALRGEGEKGRRGSRESA